MKTSFKLLAIIAPIFLSFDLMAQNYAPRFIPFSHTEQPFKVLAKPEFKLSMQSLSGPQLPFMNHLPFNLPGENIKHIMEHPQTDPAQLFNMPIIKPGKTTDIPTGKLDPNSPYTYHMPIRKSVIKE